MALSPKQLDFLQHATGCDEFGRRQVDRNHFVTDRMGSDGQVCESLVDLGLMDRYEPNAATGGMHLYRVTQTGRDAIKNESPPPTKISKARQRYLDYQNADSGLTFFDWLKARRKAPA